MHEDSLIIDQLGGTTAVAKLCEIKAGSVSEWRRKGIPRARRMYLRVIRPDIFGPGVGHDPVVTASEDDALPVDRRHTDRRVDDRHASAAPDQGDAA